MALGPGKYDRPLTAALELLVAVPNGPPTGLLLILNGPLGPGFACHCRREELVVVPAILRQLANAIEKNLHEIAH